MTVMSSSNRAAGWLRLALSTVHLDQGAHKKTVQRITRQDKTITSEFTITTDNTLTCLEVKKTKVKATTEALQNSDQ